MFNITVKMQQQCINISILLWHVSVFLDYLQDNIQRYGVQSLHIMYCGISYNLQGLYKNCLTFKNRASHIEDGRTPNLQMLHYIYTFSTNISTEYFKRAAHSPFFSSKCRLFHNDTFFGYCIIHILHTECAKI